MEVKEKHHTKFAEAPLEESNVFDILKERKVNGKELPKNNQPS